MTHAMLFTGVDVVDGDAAALAGRELAGATRTARRASSS